MAGIETYTMTTDDLVRTADVGRCLILQRLYDDGILTEEQVSEYAMNYTVALRKPSTISCLWKDVMRKSDEMHYFLVKNVSLKPDTEATT